MMQHSGALFQRNEDLEARAGARLGSARQVPPLLRGISRTAQPPWCSAPPSALGRGLSGSWARSHPAGRGRCRQADLEAVAAIGIPAAAPDHQALAGLGASEALRNRFSRTCLSAERDRGRRHVARGTQLELDPAAAEERLAVQRAHVQQQLGTGRCASRPSRRGVGGAAQEVVDAVELGVEQAHLVLQRAVAGALLSEHVDAGLEHGERVARLVGDPAHMVAGSAGEAPPRARRSHQRWRAWLRSARAAAPSRTA